MRSDINRVETKVDGAIVDIKEIKKDVSLLLEHDDIDTYNINAAHKEIKEVNNKLDNVTADLKAQRRFNQKVTGDISNDVQELNERVGQLEQEKKAS